MYLSVRDVTLVRLSAALALVAGLVWLCIESAVIADSDTMSGTLSAIPVVALKTQYGQWFTVRCILLLVLLAVPLSRRIGLISALILGGAALAVQPIVMDYRARLKEIAAHAGMPHDLPMISSAQPGETCGPMKPALDAAFKPLGYSCRGGSGSFDLRRRTPAKPAE